MVLGSWRFRIGLVNLDECLDVLDCVISVNNEIRLMCISVDNTLVTYTR